MQKFSIQHLLLLCTLLFSGFAVQAQQVSDADLKSLILKNAAKLHLSPTDVNDALVSSSFYDAATGMQHIYLQQGYQSIGVLNEIKTIALKNDEVVFSSGKFIADLASKVPAYQPSIGAPEALRKAANYLSLSAPAAINVVADRFTTEKKYILGPSGIAKQNIEVKMVWVEDDATLAVHLAWEVSIDVNGSADWWNIRVDALSGNYINKNNLTVYDRWDRVEDDNNVGNKPGVANYPGLPALLQKKKGSSFTIVPIVLQAAPPPPATTSATYRVIPLPYESPYNIAPTLVTNPWEKAGTNNRATSYKWHYDGTDYDSTRGNNVHAYLDASNLNSAGRPNFTARSTTPLPSLTFGFNPNYNIQPSDTTNRLYNITNLFYLNNMIHDITYQYGFTEAAGNFQNTNIFDGVNRGGSGGDYVRAEAQDGSGTDNANFSTPADGSSGRMQMYLWAGPTTFNVTAPSAIAGSYFAKESGFSTNNKLKNIGTFSDTVVYYNDTTSGTHNACIGFGGTMPTSSIAGKIALIDRGICGFAEKVKNAQNAGASGVLMINNAAGLPITMGGTDNTITIPAVMLSITDGALIKSQLNSNQVVTLTMSAGADRDGDVDNGIITHEYTHGISNRLTGGRVNASCLGNAEQGGEGWSDFVALMLTTNWDSAAVTDGPKPRPVGNYAAAYLVDGPGIRAYPYTTNMGLNPHTYADVATNTEVHATGEVWCTVLWDMAWFIIQQENKITGNIYDTSGTGGNIIAMKLVMEGMKLQTCRPGFLDARDAILAADSILFGFKHKCSIWNAFARRGMGVSAVQGLSTSATDQVAAYDIPAAIYLGRSITPATVQTGSNVTINITASCQCQIPNSGFVRDTIPAGFRYVSSSSGGTLNNGVVSFPVDFFNTVNETKTLSVTMKAIDAGCNITISINDNRDGSTIGGLNTTALTGTTVWVPSNTRYRSAGNSWYAADVAGIRDFVLTSSAFTVGNLSVLSLWHYYVLEDKLDGGRIEYSTNSGTTWLDAAPYILQNGYNDTTTGNSPWGTGLKVFTGVSYAQSSGQFINTLVDLSSFAGQSVQIRFRMRTNATNASNQVYDGWFIDDITLQNGCGGLNKVGLFGSANARLDSVMNPVFIIPSALPLNLLSFTANAIGQSVLLNWHTTNEVNTKSFVVEHSTDAASWTETGSLNAKGSGAGTYALYDTKPADGKNYYRIRMVDKDGTVTYSPVQSVIFSAKGNSVFTIMPNPANTSATLYLDKNIKSGKVLVYDEHGRTVQTLTISNLTNGYQLQTSKLAAGTYWVNIKTGTTVETGKLIVAH